MEIHYKDYIESNQGILHGKPCIKGTRIPVSLILGYLAHEYSFNTIIEEFPDITKEQIYACLDYARALSEFKLVV